MSGISLLLAVFRAVTRCIFISAGPVLAVASCRWRAALCCSTRCASRHACLHLINPKQQLTSVPTGEGVHSALKQQKRSQAQAFLLLYDTVCLKLVCISLTHDDDVCLLQDGRCSRRGCKAGRFAASACNSNSSSFSSAECSR
jgi:hypothetical protein